MNYYNEIDPYCAQWLRNLIDANLIPDGHVDQRDIRDVTPNDLKSYIQCHFFAGLGGWPLALRLAAIPADRPLWTGSCPCQPFSAAGSRRGFADERHLWPFWYHLIGQCKPAAILGEQVAKATDWLRLVRSDLEALDYAVGAMPIEAASAGAFHLRDRYWFVAHQVGNELRLQPWRSSRPSGTETPSSGDTGSLHLGNPDSQRLALGPLPEKLPGNVWDQGAPAGETGDGGGNLGHPQSIGWLGRQDHQDEGRRELACGHPGEGGDVDWIECADGKVRPVEPGVRLLAYAIPDRVAKLRAFGNAICPPTAAAFIRAAL